MGDGEMRGWGGGGIGKMNKTNLNFPVIVP